MRTGVFLLYKIYGNGDKAIRRQLQLLSHLRFLGYLHTPNLCEFYAVCRRVAVNERASAAGCSYRLLVWPCAMFVFLSYGRVFVTWTSWPRVPGERVGYLLHTVESWSSGPRIHWPVRQSRGHDEYSNTAVCFGRYHHHLAFSRHLVHYYYYYYYRCCLVYFICKKI